MDLDQLLDPTRLASIWDAETRRVHIGDLAPRWSEDEPEAAAPDADASDAAIDRDVTVVQSRDDIAHPGDMHDHAAAPLPEPRDSLRALQEHIEALFAEGTDQRRIVQAQLAPMHDALASAGPIAAQQLDDLEDLLEAFLVARNWAAEPGGRR